MIELPRLTPPSLQSTMSVFRNEALLLISHIHLSGALSRILALYSCLTNQELLYLIFSVPPSIFTSKFRYICGRTLVISRRLMFLPIQVRVPAPNCTSSSAHCPHDKRVLTHCERRSPIRYLSVMSQPSLWPEQPHIRPVRFFVKVYGPSIATHLRLSRVSTSPSHQAIDLHPRGRTGLL